jgi:hypothetical protein
VTGARQVMRDEVTKRAVGRHIARFILVGLYTGTRHAAICSAALAPAIGRGYVDVERGVFHRRAKGAKATILVTEKERGPGTTITYVRPSSLILFEVPPPLQAAAKALDEKLEALIAKATAA